MLLNSTKQIFFGFLAIVIGFLSALLIGEIGLRLFLPQETGPIQYAFHPELGYIPFPNQRGRRTLPQILDYTYSNNSLGLRGSREYSFGPSHKKRILFLGDSFTYGLGVNDDQTFCSLIQKRLGEESYEIINAGNPVKGTDYALKVFTTIGAKYQPNLVALCFFCNDFSDNQRKQYYKYLDDGTLTPRSLEPSLNRYKRWTNEIPGYNWMISHSHLVNLVKQTAIKFLTRDKSQLVVTYERNGLWHVTPENVKITRAVLASLGKAVDAAGASFVVFYIPTREEVLRYRQEKDLSEDELTIKRLVDSVSQRGLLSLTPVLGNEATPLAELYLAEGHWTPIAHSIAAGYMAECITEILN